MKNNILYFLLIVNSCCVIAQQNVFYVGHSLVNHTMPRMVSEIAKSKGFSSHNYKEQVINGSPLKNSWNNSHNGENAINFKTDYNSTFNTLVITEAVPLDNHLQWNQTHYYAHNFFDFAENTNANTSSYIYETWHCIKSGTPDGCSYDAGGSVAWRTRLDTYLPKWESIADSVMNRGLLNTVHIIPGGQAMAALYDSLQSAKIPGYSAINEFFADDIHPNDLGNYYIACVQFATIFKQSPEGAIADVKNQYNVSYNIPHTNTALIAKLQQMAWDVACNYSRSGLNCSIQTGIQNPSTENELLKVYPNPVNSLLNIQAEGSYYEITNIYGQTVASGLVNNQMINVESITNGLFVLKIKNQSIKFQKE